MRSGRRSVAMSPCSRGAGYRIASSARHGGALSANEPRQRPSSFSIDGVRDDAGGRDENTARQRTRLSEASRFRLRLACEDCAHFAARAGSRVPSSTRTHEHRDSVLRSSLASSSTVRRSSSRLMPSGARTGPALLTLVERAMVEDTRLARPGDLVLVACSGGPDSSALPPHSRYRGDRCDPPGVCRVAVHGIDHGLRAGASAELDLAERLAAKHELSFSRSAVTVEPGGNLSGPGSCRPSRPAPRRSRPASVRRPVASRPHRRRGAPRHWSCVWSAERALRGIAGCCRRALGLLVRPTDSCASRRCALLHLERHRVPFATDPSNAGFSFLRTRVRCRGHAFARDVQPASRRGALWSCRFRRAGLDLPAESVHLPVAFKAGGARPCGAPRPGRVSVRFAGGRDVVVPTPRAVES